MNIFGQVAAGFKMTQNNMQKAISGVSKSSQSATPNLNGLAASINSINSAAKNNASVNPVVNNLTKLGKAIGGLAVTVGAVKVFGDVILEYNDAARMAARGTALLSSSVEGTDKAINSLQEYGAAIKLWSGFQLEESMKLAASMRSDFMKSTAIDFSSNQQEIAQYTQSLELYQKTAALGAQDLQTYHNKVIAEGNLSIRESKSLLEAITAATKFSLSGPESVQAISESMADAIATDEKHRQNFLKRQLEVAALQKQAAFDFSKYTSTLVKSRGAESLTTYAKISAVTGKSLGEITSAFRGAGAEAAKNRLSIQKEYLNSMISLDQYQALRDKASTGELTSSESSQLMVMEAIAAPFLKDLNLSIEDILAGNNIGKSGKLETDISGGLNTKFAGLDSSLKVTTEVISSFNTVIHNTTLDALKALGGNAQDAATALRTIAGLSSQGKFGAALAGGLGGLFGATIPSIISMIRGGAGAGAGGGLGGMAGIKAMAGRAGIAGWTAAVGLDAGITAWKLKDEEGRQELKDTANWNFTDNPMDYAKALGRSFLNPIQTITGSGMNLDPFKFQKSISEAISTRDQDSNTDRVVSVNKRRLEEVRNGMTTEQFAERERNNQIQIKAISEARARIFQSMADSGEKMEQAIQQNQTAVQVKATAIKEAKPEEPKKLDQTPTKTESSDPSSILANLLKDQNTIPILSDIRDMLSNLMMSAGTPLS